MSDLKDMNKVTGKTLGITVMPEYIQSEGIEAVLDRCQEAGIRQIATSPYYMHEVPEGAGHREPPIDAGSGKVRLLDRPLWGKNEVWFKVSPSFRPNPELYTGLAYQPMTCDEQPDDLLQRFMAEANKRGIETHFQIMAAIPPALRVQDGKPLVKDLPLLPNGKPLEKPLSRNGSLASADIVAFVQALTRDLADQYPHLAGIRYDWPEYPCYHLDATFTDFNPQVQPIAAAAGFKFEAIRQGVDALWQRLHQLTNDDLNADSLFDLAPATSAIHDWQQLKAHLARRFSRALCMTAREAGLQSTLHAFPPPFSGLTGFDFAACGAFADGIGMKLYTMHLPMILNHYGAQLMDWNPGLDETRLTAMLNRWLDLTDEPLDSLADYKYPLPDQPHQVSLDAQKRKIHAATAQSAKVHTLVHTYGPLTDFSERLALAIAETPDGIWLNRYCYLDDVKHAELTVTTSELMK